MIIAGHYKGIDERVKDRFATDIISIGSYVLTGGEIAATVFVDSIVRLIPGTLNDSLMDGDIIEAPYYTRPAEYKNMKVPEVLLSGHEKNIRIWKEEKSKLLTEKWKKINNLE